MNRFTLRPMSAVSLAALFVGVACTGGCSLFNKSSGQPQAQAAAAPAPAVAAAAPAQQQQQPAEAVLAGDISSPQTGIATWKSVAELRQDLIIRPEMRYDLNSESRPFEDRHGLFTAATDVILRW